MSEEPIPSAPSSIPCRTSARIWSSCSGVGFRSSRPITCSRIVVAPMNEATFVETPRFSSSRRYSASVVQVMSYLMSPHLLDQACLHAVVERAHRAALAEDLERDALADVALRASVHEQRLGRPREHVDEAGRHRQVRRVDRHAGARRSQASDARDPVAFDSDVDDAAGIARTVVHRAVPDDGVERGRLFGRVGRGASRAGDRDRHGQKGSHGDE